jgi:hypothetical protein
VDKRLRHLGTSREELQRDYGITFDYKKVGNLREQDNFLQKIFESGFTPRLQEMAKRQHTLLLRYFEQEGILDGSSCAAVDVGWLGTSRLMMNRILQSQGYKEMMSFYYGVRSDVFPPSAGRYMTYFHPDEMPIGATTLLEHYYSASPYPTTVGYEENASHQVTPQFPEGEKFAHTVITLANEHAMNEMARLIVDEEMYKDSHLMKTWARRTLEILLKENVKVDLTPLTVASAFDEGIPYVRRFSIFELFKFVCLSGSVTAFDVASFRITVPRCLWSPLWKIHLFTGKVRAKVGRKFLKK